MAESVEMIDTSSKVPNVHEFANHIHGPIAHEYDQDMMLELDE